MFHRRLSREVLLQLNEKTRHYEQLYRDLNGAAGSVHWSRFPEANEALIDRDLERRMALAQRMTSLVLSLRKKEKIRVRQPLLRIVVPVLNATQHADLDAIEELLLHEVNVKKLDRVGSDSGLFVRIIFFAFKKATSPNPHFLRKE
jgi:isoleucyl-tRNA synthetase